MTSFFTKGSKRFFYVLGKRVIAKIPMVSCSMNTKRHSMLDPVGLGGVPS